MSEKYELYKHEGPRKTDGRKLNRLQFSLESGQPIIEDILDVVAYLRKPRVLQDGKVKEYCLTLIGKIDWMLEHARLLHFHKKRKRGRPRKLKEIEELFEDELSWDVDYEEIKKTSAPSGRMPGRKYRREWEWRKLSNETLMEMLKHFWPINRKIKGKGNLLEAFIVLLVFAKVCIKLKEKQIKAICGYVLTKQGYTFKEVEKLLKVNYRTVKKWGSYVEAILKKNRQFPYMSYLPHDASRTWVKYVNGKPVRYELHSHKKRKRRNV